MYRDVEFVCSGNNGRSPIAEAVGKRILDSLGLNANVRITSSGTQVDFSKVRDLAGFIAPFVEQAIRREIFPRSYAELVKKDSQKVLDEMFEIEETWRNNYILNFVNPGFGNHSRQQTLVRSEAQLILPVDQSNFERVAKIYKSSGYSPKIETLAEYAGLEYNRPALHNIEISALASPFNIDRKTILSLNLNNQFREFNNLFQR